MISEEAVEAAAAGMWDDAKPVKVGVRPRWETVSNDPNWKYGVDSTRREAHIALEAAAPHMQQKATTQEELDALPEGAMVRTDTGFYLKERLKYGTSTWVTTNEQWYFKTENVTLPAMVIYLPYRSQA